MFALAQMGQADVFKITVENFGPQPFSPTFFSASDQTFDIFTLGHGASTGIKNIAERGNATVQLGYAAAAGPAVGAYGLVGSSPLAPGLSRTSTFNTDSAHGYFSFANMLGKTNDGFVGESVSSSAYNLYNGSGPRDLVIDIFGDRAWDAGTELNTQNAADLGFLGGSGNPADSVNFVRRHAGVIPGVGDSFSQIPAWTEQTHLGRITVQSVPEPASMAILGMGLLGLARRKKRS